MEFQTVVRRRRMVRRFADRPVDPATVDRMLANAVRAPSAGFTQGWAFLVLDRQEDLDRFWRSNGPDGGSGALEAGPESPGDSGWLAGMRTAPVLIVPMSSKAAYLDRYAEPDKGWVDRAEHRWPVPYWHVDAGMAALLILQTAVDAGLGACLFGVPPERLDAFRAEFGVPPSYTPVGAVAVGHRTDDAGAAGSPSRRRRRPLAEVVHRGGW